jgi:predicted nucleic acid-binding protein
LNIPNLGNYPKKLMKLFMTSKIIIDTDFLYGLFLSTDPHHERATEIMSRIYEQSFIVTSLVKYELITLLSRRENQQRALIILDQLMDISFEEYFVEQKDDAVIMKEFMSHNSKKISIVDCANLVIAKKLNAKIASFDKFYPENLMIF